MSNPKLKPKPKPRPVAQLLEDPNVLNPLREWLADRGMSQAQAARLCGVNYKLFQGWGLGYSRPDPEAVQLMADTFNVDPIDLPLR